MERILTASNLLRTALEQYTSACHAFPSCYTHEDLSTNACQELSNCVANELRQFKSYGKKLNQAKTALKQARNRCTIIVPISALPDEIMTFIFRLIVNSQPCFDKEHEQEELEFPYYPELLSHVCSRWRQLAISSRTLWSHLDIAPYHSANEEYLARAEVFAARAGDSPLYIHVLALDFEGKFEDYRLEHEGFLNSVRAQIRSLELNVGSICDAEDVEDNVNILESCLDSCKPGTLTQLTITDGSCSTLNFLESFSFEHPDCPRSMLTSLSHKYLEKILHPVTVLRLYGLYPYWTSKAYHNLVELRLSSNHDLDIPISEQQLCDILMSSPKLRIFHFDLWISPTVVNATILPVHLSELEVLSLSSMSHQLGLFLRWITPGSLPLKFSIANSPHIEQLLLNAEVRNFFKRSKITTLCLADFSVSYLELTQLIDLLSSLRVLIIANSCLEHGPSQLEASRSNPDERKALAKSFRLDRLDVRNCQTDLDGLWWMIQKDAVHTLTCKNCTFAQGTLKTGRDAQEIRSYLSNVCPIVEFIVAEQDPLYARD